MAWRIYEDRFCARSQEYSVEYKFPARQGTVFLDSQFQTNASGDGHITIICAVPTLSFERMLQLCSQTRTAKCVCLPQFFARYTTFRRTGSCTTYIISYLSITEITVTYRPYAPRSYNGCAHKDKKGEGSDRRIVI